MNLYNSSDVRFVQCPVGFGFEDRLFDMLAEDTAGSLDVKDCCDRIGIDRYGISRRFKEVYGRTPYAFQKHHRILQSAVALATGDERMTEVARRFGYTKEGKFAKAFKEEFGIRPKHFRSEYLESLDFDDHDRKEGV